jgi:hypothetical protein
MLVNENNFLRWDNGVGVAGYGDLPHGYVQDPDRCTTAIVAVPDETMAFYLNVPDGLALGTFADLKLTLINSRTGAVAQDNAATLEQHVIAGSNYNIFTTFLFPDVAKGLYHFRLRKVSDDTVVLTSNHFEVWTENYANKSMHVKFRHDRYFYGILYGATELEDFYQEFRLNMNVIDEQPEIDREVYKEQTTGKRREFKTDLDKVIKVESYYFSLPDHWAAIVMFEHLERYLNGKEHITKAAYQIGTEQRGKTCKGTIELYDQEFAALNRCLL